MNDVYLCPDCGDDSVDVSALSGGGAKCRICDWTGEREELILQQNVNAPDAEQMIDLFIHEIRTHIAASAGSGLMKLLVTWGFLPHPNSSRFKEQMTTYLNAICTACAKTIVETHTEMQKKELAARR